MSKVYIEKEAALEPSKHLDHENGNKHFVWGIETYAEYLQRLPSADVKPVVHAHWISVPHKRARICSRCGCDEPYKFADEYADVYEFCAHCGADMREKIKSG